MRILGVIAMASMMAGCGGSGRGEQSPEQGANETRTTIAAEEPEIPEAVRTWMAADFPADGEVHVQSIGQFEIKPETPVCYLEGMSFISSPDLFGRLRQPWHSSGGDRQELYARATHCRNDPSAVLIKNLRVINFEDESYKLVGAIWQGDAAHGGAMWVGMVGRSGGRYPLFADAQWLPQSQIVAQSVGFDAERLSNQFTSSIGENIRGNEQ